MQASVDAVERIRVMEGGRDATMFSGSRLDVECELHHQAEQRTLQQVFELGGLVFD